MDSLSESNFLKGEDIVFSSLVSLHFDEENTDIDLLRNECSNNEKTLIDEELDSTFSISYIDPKQTKIENEENTLLSPVTSLWSCESLNSPSSIETLRDSVRDRPYFTNTNGTMLNYTPFDNSNKTSEIGDWLKTLSVKSMEPTHDTFLDNSFRIDAVMDSRMNEEFVDDDDLFSLTFNPEDFSTSTNKHFESIDNKNKIIKTRRTAELVNDFMVPNNGEDSNNDDDAMQVDESDELQSYNHLNNNVSRMVRSSTVKSFCHTCKPEPLEISTIGVKSNNPHQTVSRDSKTGQIPIMRKNKMNRNKGIKKLKNYLSKTFKKLKNQKNPNFFTFDETTVISRYIPELSKSPAIYNSDDTLFKDNNLFLNIKPNSDGLLNIEVIKGHNLKLNKNHLDETFLKFSIMTHNQEKLSWRSGFVMGSQDPLYEEGFTLNVNEDDYESRLLIRLYQASNEDDTGFLVGCMSFCMSNLLQRGIEGNYHLLPKELGTKKHLKVVTGHSTIRSVVFYPPKSLKNHNRTLGCQFSSTTPATITTTTNNGLASMCGLFPGDQIVSINGYDVSGTSPSLVEHFLSNEESNLKIMVRRKIIKKDYKQINNLIDIFNKKSKSVETCINDSSLLLY